MAELELFLGIVSSTNHWNLPCYVSSPFDLRESLICPLKGHLPCWVVIIAEIIQTRHECPAEPECVQTLTVVGNHHSVLQMNPEED